MGSGVLKRGTLPVTLYCELQISFRDFYSEGAPALLRRWGARFE